MRFRTGSQTMETAKEKNACFGDRRYGESCLRMQAVTTSSISKDAEGHMQ